VLVVVLVVVVEVALDRLEDAQPLADKSGGELSQPVGAVEHVDVGVGQAARMLIDDLGQLVDEHAIQSHPVVRRRGLGLDLHPLGVGPGQHARLLGLGLGGLDHLGHQLLLAQLGLALCPLGLCGDHLALRAGLGQRAGLARLGLGLVHLGLVLGLDDGGLALILGLLALGLLLGLGRRLVGLGLRDLGLALDRGVVGRGHGVD